MEKEILKEIKEYCELNELDYAIELNTLLKDGFTTLKYGATPMSHKVEKKVVERIVEVEKIVTVSDDSKLNELLEKNSLLKSDNRKILIQNASHKNRIKELEKELESNSKTDMYGE